MHPNEEEKIVVVGAGGHAKVVIDCLRYRGWTVVGCTAAPGSARTCAGVPVLGGDDLLEELYSSGLRHAFCALGDNSLRERICDRLRTLGFSLPTIVGAGAIVSPTAKLGSGVIVMPGAVINIETEIGDFAIINTNANVDHDGRIGRAAHIAPGCSLAGEVSVGDRSFVGTGTAIIPQRQIGADTIIGAGSVVVRDITDKVLALGNPARVIRALA